MSTEAAILDNLPPERVRALVLLACWLLGAVVALGNSTAEELAARPWSQVQHWLAHDDAFLLADLLRGDGFAVTDLGADKVREFLTAQGADALTIVDLARMAPVATLPVGGSPIA